MRSGARPEHTAVRPRPYRSPRRQAQARRTRDRILAAATALFCTGGYAGTTIAAIAAAAGVSVPAIELAFGTKAAVLKAAIDVAIAGDDEPVPVLERPWVTKAEAATTAREFLGVVADVLIAAAQRSDALVLAAFEAARSDERLVPLVSQLKAQRTVTAAWIVDGVSARAPFRSGIHRDDAIDVVWLLMEPAVFDRLTTDRGWPAERFGRWFADSVLRLLITCSDHERRPEAR